MASVEYVHQFGRANIYQLGARNREKSIDRDKAAHHLSGREVFSGGPSFQDMLDRQGRGFVIKKTEISEQFTMANFQEMYGEDAVLMFALKPGGGLIVMKSDEEPGELQGCKVIAFVRGET